MAATCDKRVSGRSWDARTGSRTGRQSWAGTGPAVPLISLRPDGPPYVLQTSTGPARATYRPIRTDNRVPGIGLS